MLVIRKINNIPKVIVTLEQALEAASREIGVTETANIQMNTPVKTGNLRRSINFVKAKDGNIYEIKFGSDLIYAPKVEFENKSYLRYTLRNNEDEIKQILLKYLKKVGR